MFNQERFDELNTKTKLSPQERGELKNLTRLKLKADEAATGKDKKRTNEFSIKPTTKSATTPVRFIASEQALMTKILDNLKDNNEELVLQNLGGSLKDLNKTKLIRAAILALDDLSPKQIVDYIKQVKINMVRG